LIAIVYEMVEYSHIVPFLTYSLLSGAIGTGGMTLTLHSFTRSGLVNANMVVAVGSLLTKSKESALLVGSVIHCFFGIIFALFYTLIILLAAPLKPLFVVGIGLGLGAMHGLVICFFLVATVADFHPLEEYREAGFTIGLAHLFAHVIYGLLIGIVIAFSGIAAA